MIDGTTFRTVLIHPKVLYGKTQSHKDVGTGKTAK